MNQCYNFLANHKLLCSYKSLPGSSSTAFAQFEDCGHVLVTLPGASSPQSRAGREKKIKEK